MASDQVAVKMTRLTPAQLKNKINFIHNYIDAGNAATGSIFDPNSNVSHKNVATMNAELNKDINIQIKRELVCEQIEKLWGKEVRDEYIRQLEDHEIYCHDETTIAPYCVAISMYPFLTDGLKAFGGETKSPKHLSSFNGGFVNLIFAVSAQFAGAVATVEYLMCFDHFARKDYGDNYLTEYTDIIKQELQQTIYALNQPASARGNQSPFWNISIFDKNYFDALFGNFMFPDGDKPNWSSLSALQKFFMKWFNEERTHALLTFPVVTVALLHDNERFVDEEYADFTAEELSKGNSFFIYMSDTVDSLSSCCFNGNEQITVYTPEDIERVCTIKEYVEEKLKGMEGEIEGLSDDTIISYSPMYDDRERVKITGVLKKHYDGKMYAVKVGRNAIDVTSDHLFYVRNKYSKEEREITAEELYEFYTDSEILIEENGKYVYKDVIYVHEFKPKSEFVYCIQLEKNHYFFANNILTHNCRLRNSIADQLNDFSYSLGAGGVMTGSINVLTLNMNRFIQNFTKIAGLRYNTDWFKRFINSLHDQIKFMHKCQIAFKKLYEWFVDKHMLSCYDAHFIELDKQYLTIGINGLVEGAEYLGYKIRNEREYKNFVRNIFGTISTCNKETVKEYPEYKLKINTEQVPAESVGVKFAKWDKKDGYVVPRDCYNSYIYVVEDEGTSPIDKIIMHGNETTQYLDGGSAAHINLETYPTKETFRKLLNIAAKEGCPYLCFNIKVTVCNDCGYIDKLTKNKCSKCGSENIDYATRVIGYLKKVTSFSKERQLEEQRRYYSKI